jgi:hypothetical protein
MIVVSLHTIANVDAGNIMKNFAFLAFALGAMYLFLGREQPAIINDTTANTTESATPSRDGAWRAGQQVRGSGVVGRILADDNEGSRHQRFILQLSSGQTLLVAHNIDLAPRIESLREGDTVSFYGEYETNPQGGVIHWTHKDPQGRHAHGWLEHKGRRYQ